MPIKQHTILLTSFISAAVLASLAIGIAIGRSPELLSSFTEDPKQETREAILEKLADSAQQQSQAPTSLFDPFSQTPFAGDPFAQLQQMQSQMDQLFGNLGTGPSLFNFGASGFGSGFATLAQPEIEVEESKDEYRVVISLAKGSEVELATELEDNTLSINAKVRSQINDNSNGRQLSSTSMSQFSREIPLSSPVDATGMQTEKSDSSIVIRIPKLS